MDWTGRDGSEKEEDVLKDNFVERKSLTFSEWNFKPLSLKEWKKTAASAAICGGEEE